MFTSPLQVVHWSSPFLEKPVIYWQSSSHPSLLECRSCSLPFFLSFPPLSNHTTCALKRETSEAVCWLVVLFILLILYACYGSVPVQCRFHQQGSKPSWYWSYVHGFWTKYRGLKWFLIQNKCVHCILFWIFCFVHLFHFFFSLRPLALKSFSVNVCFVRLHSKDEELSLHYCLIYDVHIPVLIFNVQVSHFLELSSLQSLTYLVRGSACFYVGWQSISVEGVFFLDCALFLYCYNSMPSSQYMIAWIACWNHWSSAGVATMNITSLPVLSDDWKYTAGSPTVVTTNPDDRGHEMTKWGRRSTSAAKSQTL